MARLCPLGGLHQARLARLEGQILFARTRGGAAARQLTEAARRLEAEDAGVVPRDLLGGDQRRDRRRPPRRSEHGVRAVAAAALAGPPARQPSMPSDTLLDGVAAWLTEGDAAFPAMRVALHDYLEAPVAHPARQHDVAVHLLRRPSGLQPPAVGARHLAIAGDPSSRAVPRDWGR